MGIKRIGYGDKYKALGYSEYICDTESDLDLLPTNKSSKVVDGSVLPKCSAGSRAIVVESKKVYVLNTDGVWSEFIDHSGAGGGSGAVTSVNGKTGAVVLDASDVGALPDDTVIPPAVTEQDVAGWGFTKNTGTYSKPDSGIPVSDLASAVQTSLGKADTALQQHQSLSGYATETWVQQQGYLTQHQDITGKADKIPRIAKASTDTTAALNPNTLYVFPEMSALTVTLATPSDNTIVNEYHFIFTSGATATTTTFPAIPGLDDFAAEADTVYEVSILEGRALVTSWEVSA